ncbi:MAG: signal peptidase I [Coprococcus sp.]
MSERKERIRRIRRDRRRQRKKERSFKKTVKNILSWLISILAAAIVAYGFVAFMFQSVYMVGSSMSPTIIDKEKCIVNKLVYVIGKPERFDIVAYRTIENSESYYDIKRVIGLPGETVLIANGNVYVNGNPIPGIPIEDYIFTAGLAEKKITLGDDEYFLLGDNVNNSQDSRYLNIGNIKESEILGRIKK